MKRTHAPNPHPAILAAELCRARGGDFREEVEAFLLNGFVFSGDDYFLMGRPVPRQAGAPELWAPHPRQACDAWFVWIGVGRWAQLLALMPYELPWLGWYRQGRDWQECHWIKCARLRFRA